MRTNTARNSVSGLVRPRVEAVRAALAERESAGGGYAADREGGGGVDDAAALALREGLHEWFDADEPIARGEGVWLPPIAVLVGLAWRALGEDARRVVWVGRGCWPYPPALVRRSGGVVDARLLDRSVFVEARSRPERVWAVELAARCTGVAAVVGDGRGLTMAESRRLQLAARRSPLLVVRTARERGELSAARTRWRVAPMDARDGHTHHQGWLVELLRCKGLRPETGGMARRWIVRRDHGTGELLEWTPGDVGLAAEVGDRSAPAEHARRA